MTKKTSKIYPWKTEQNFENTEKIYLWQTNAPLTKRQQKNLDEKLIEECRADHDNAESIQALLKRGANPNAEVNGNMGLRYAIENNKLNTARALLEGGQKFDYKSDLLQNAAEKGYLDMVELLLKYGATVDGKEGHAPLYVAAEKGYLDIAKLLLDNSAKVDDIYNKLLHVAIRFGHPDIVEMLISRGAKTSSKDEYGSNALHIVAEQATYYIHSAEAKEKYLRIAKIILNTEDIEINAKDTKNYTPIFLAADPENMDMVKLLLERGADPNIRNQSGRTVLGLMLSSETIAHELIRKGARLSENDVRWSDIRTKIEYTKLLLKERSSLRPDLFGEGDYNPIKDKDVMDQMGKLEMPTSTSLSANALSKNPDPNHKSQKIDTDKLITTETGSRAAAFLSAVRGLGIKPKQAPKANVVFCTRN